MDSTLCTVIIIIILIISVASASDSLCLRVGNRQSAVVITCYRRVWGFIKGSETLRPTLTCHNSTLGEQCLCCVTGESHKAPRRYKHKGKQCSQICPQLSILIILTAIQVAQSDSSKSGHSRTEGPHTPGTRPADLFHAHQA